jgi:uncharacterized membrane protein YdjX (TVP38/TMEM64 family)
MLDDSTSKRTGCRVSSQAFSGNKKSRLLKVAILAILVVASLVLVIRGVNLIALRDWGIAAVRESGPGLFFAAMAILPALGVPMLAFTLSAGPMFGDRLGIGLVVMLSLAAITVNVILSYFFARYTMRPVIERLMAWLGYSLPKIPEGDITDVIIIVRVTPGIPFFAQNYLLGLAGVPFRKYLVVTCILTWVLSGAFVFFGDALVRGQGKVAILTGCLVIAATATTHLIRKHYSKKKLRHAAPSPQDP